MFLAVTQACVDALGDQIAPLLDEVAALAHDRGIPWVLQAPCSRQSSFVMPLRAFVTGPVFTRDRPMSVFSEDDGENHCR